MFPQNQLYARVQFTLKRTAKWSWVSPVVWNYWCAAAAHSVGPVVPQSLLRLAVSLLERARWRRPPAQQQVVGGDVGKQRRWRRGPGRSVQLTYPQRTAGAGDTPSPHLVAAGLGAQNRKSRMNYSHLMGTFGFIIECFCTFDPLFHLILVVYRSVMCLICLNMWICVNW